MIGSVLITVLLSFAVIRCGVGFVQCRISPHPRRTEEQTTVTHVPNPTPLHLLLLFVHRRMRQFTDQLPAK